MGLYTVKENLPRHGSVHKGERDMAIEGIRGHCPTIMRSREEESKRVCTKTCPKKEVWCYHTWRTIGDMG